MKSNKLQSTLRVPQMALPVDQLENVRRIVLKAREYTERNIKEAAPGDAILITSRWQETEKQFRDRGVNLE